MCVWLAHLLLPRLVCRCRCMPAIAVSPAAATYLLCCLQPCSICQHRLATRRCDYCRTDSLLHAFTPVARLPLCLTCRNRPEHTPLAAQREPHFTRHMRLVQGGKRRDTCTDCGMLYCDACFRYVVCTAAAAAAAAASRCSLEASPLPLRGAAAPAPSGGLPHLLPYRRQLRPLRRPTCLLVVPCLLHGHVCQGACSALCPGACRPCASVRVCVLVSSPVRPPAHSAAPTCTPRGRALVTT